MLLWHILPKVDTMHFRHGGSASFGWLRQGSFFFLSSFLFSLFSLFQKIKKQNEVRDAAGLKKFPWSLQRPSQGPEKWSPVMPGYRATFKNDSSIHQSDVLFCYFHSFFTTDAIDWRFVKFGGNWQAFDDWWVGLCVLASTLFHSLCLVFLIRLLLLSTTTTTKMLQLTTTNFLS